MSRHTISIYISICVYTYLSIYLSIYTFKDLKKKRKSDK